MLAGIFPSLSAKAVLITPAAPAAAVRCPMLLFTEPIAQNCPLSAACRKARVKASTSIGSPNGVAVP